MPVEFLAAAILSGILIVLVGIQGIVIPFSQGLAWGLGNRDEDIAQSVFQQRLARTIANHKETMLMVLPLIALVVALDRTDATTALACWLVIGGRLAFVPLYLSGIFGVRTIAFGVAFVGTVMLLVRLA